MYCQCGCGELTTIADRTRPQWGSVKGQPRRFVRGHQSRVREPGWRGGHYKQDRFEIKDRGFSTPCWVWVLATTKTGYGSEWDPTRRRMVAPHILAYERAYGAVPEGLELDHLCHVRACVNPAHLEAVTHGVNVSRSDHKTNNFNAAKTHCPKGHPYEGDNLITEKSGTRRCRACRRERRTRGHQ